MVACSKCGRRAAVVKLYYDGSDLCGKCFCQRFEKRVMKANRDFGLFRRGDVIAVAVSGGKDSAALLYVLNKLAKKIGGITLKPLLVDEGVKGYRDKAAKKAQALCKKLGLKLSIVSFKEDFGVSLDKALKTRDKKHLTHRACSVCGVFRKAALNKAARGLHANKLAVGHNADDVAQTFLMNLMRSDVGKIKSFGALSGFFEQDLFVRRIKPLIYNSERECALYCTLNGLPFYLGSCPYAVEAFRGQVKDFLNDVEAKHPGTKLAVLSSFFKLQKQLPNPEKIRIGSCEKCGEHSSSKKCKACKYVEELGGKNG